MITIYFVRNITYRLKGVDAMSEVVVSLKDVGYAYEEKLVLDDINFEIPRGAFIGLVGPNGGGKTTLIQLILGLKKPDNGCLLYTSDAADEG